MLSIAGSTSLAGDAFIYLQKFRKLNSFNLRKLSYLLNGKANIYKINSNEMRISQNIRNFAVVKV